VIYRGSVAEQPDALVFDNHHLFPTGKVVPVCGNTFDMLHESRLKAHFEFIGDKSRHFGIFPDCGLAVPFTATTQDSADLAGACC